MPIVRVLVSLVIAALLVRLALSSADRPRRRGAFVAGAALFALSTVLNALIALGVAVEPFYTPFAIVAGALMLVSLVLLFLAYRSGELKAQANRLNEAFGEERRKRGL